MPATILGKRKSRTATEEESPSISQEEALAIFQRHFEAQFKPLPPSQIPAAASAAKPEPDPEESLSDGDDVDGASEDSWSGVSGAEDSYSDEDEIEVVSHTKNTPSAAADVSGLSKRELKALLSSRVPSVATTTSSSSSSKRKPATDGEGEGEEDAPSLLKNDLALQRLLTESHLFSKSSSSSSTATPNNNTTTEHAGRNRHLANDLRLAALGSKRSVYAQARMPMGIRKGIAGAAAAREDKRRREARENGVVLERKSGGGGVVPAAGDWLRGFGAKRKGGGGGERRRKGGGGDRIAVDAPAVGRLRNGMLKLSRRDISEIQGSGGGSGMTKGKKRRR
ncbi:hypothetical protein DL769_007150 [Monosporascus sp. CRB-8-3]|nr:hypothetical protein DL769_007150 [Monosporascus sp. CRB-8-3]